MNWTDLDTWQKRTAAVVFFVGLAVTAHSPFVTKAWAAEQEGQTRQMRIDAIEAQIFNLELAKARESDAGIKAMLNAQIEKLKRKRACVDRGGKQC